MTSVPQDRTGMSQVAGSRLPKWSVVLAAHVRAMGFTLRGPLLVGVALALVATVLIIVRVMSHHVNVDLDIEPSPLFGLVGALLPLAVWMREERFGPAFLWTLPVDRRRHALTTVLAGWIWLVAGVAIAMLWLVVLAVISGGHVLPAETIHVLTTPVRVSTLDPAAVQSVNWDPGAVMALVPFTAATATYMLASALMLGTRHPLRWVIGVVLSYSLASFASHVASKQLDIGWLADAPERGLRWLIEGRYGLDALITARTASLDNDMTLSGGGHVSVWSAVPDMADWRVATLLWIGVGLVALVAAASRHREQRRA